jgi:hypothetical protein
MFIKEEVLLNGSLVTQLGRLRKEISKQRKAANNYVEKPTVYSQEVEVLQVLNSAFGQQFLENKSGTLKICRKKKILKRKHVDSWYRYVIKCKRKERMVL